MILLIISVFFSIFSDKANKKSSHNNDISSTESEYDNFQFLIPKEDILFNKENKNLDYTPKISVQNSIFRGSVKVNYLIGNSLSSKISEKEESEFMATDNFEELIEDNYFETCGASGYINHIEYTSALLRNNTYDFNKINSCGAILISKPGNFTIIDCRFISIASPYTIYYQPDEASSKSDFLFIEDCTFTECKGACCYFDIQSQSSTEITVSNCAFIGISTGSSSLTLISTSEQSNFVKLTVINNTFIQFSDNENNLFAIRISILESNDNDNFLTFENNLFEATCSGILIDQRNGHALLRNNTFKDLNGYPIMFSSLSQLSIYDSTFVNCTGGIEIVHSIGDAEIENCILTDCCGNQQRGAILIYNERSRINNNIINFSSNEYRKSAPGLVVSSHGEIEVTNNQFINICRTNSSGISINNLGDKTTSLPDSEIKFNYNTIINAGNAFMGIFDIEKSLPFNFDHNIIKDCKITDYSTQIIFRTDDPFVMYSLTNLTFINNSASGRTGGGLGLWLFFSKNTGRFTLKDCTFEGNKITVNGGYHSFGCGGAFETGNASVLNKEFIADNCTFVGNMAQNCGGALSIQSSLAATIINCTFISNEANDGGGAIYIYPMDSRLPICTISGCKFESNKDSSNNGHAIFFKYRSGCSTILEIKDCSFIDNAPIGSPMEGNTISSDAPFLKIEDTTITFSDSILSTTGLMVNTNTNNLTINNCKFNNIKESSCILSNQFTIINRLNVSSPTSSPTAITIYYFNPVLINGLTVRGANTAIEVTSTLTSPIQFDVSSSSFEKNLFSFDIQDDISIQGMKIDSCTSTQAGSTIFYLHDVDSLSVKNSEIKSCNSNDIFLIESIPQLSFEDITFISNNLPINNNQKSYPFTFNGIAEISNVVFKRINCDTTILTITEDNTYSINNAVFTDCKTNNYIIQANTDFQISDSKFEFTNSNIKSKCIKINTVGTHKIISTEFIRTHGTAFEYNQQNANSNPNYLLNMTNVTFDSCDTNSNDNIIYIGISHPLVFQSNAFKSINSSSFIAKFYIKSLEELSLESCIFINNNVSLGNSNNYGGGSGFYFMTSERDGRLTFTNCKWINNYESKDYGGGGFQIGEPDSANFELHFSKCHFEGNQGKKGGALAIQTQRSLYISDCKFLNNVAYAKDGGQNLYGGAIHINLVTKDTIVNKVYNYEITKCSFTGNHAYANKGNAIYIQVKNEMDVVIDDSNTFINNNLATEGGSIIMFNGDGNTRSDATFYLNFKEIIDDDKSSIIEVGNDCSFSLKNSNFTHCQTIKGNVILIRPEATLAALENCIFTNCVNQDFIIKVLGLSGRVDIQECSFTFDTPVSASCAIDIQSKGQVRISQCTFVKNNNDHNELNAGSFYYHPTDPTGRLTFTTCSFVECTGSKYKTFSLVLANVELDIYGITINNTGTEQDPNTEYICGINLGSLSSFDFNSWHFNNNFAQTKFGGGSAIETISNTTDPLHFVFYACQWFSNHAKHSENVENRYNGIGGAYQQGGSSQALTNVYLTFDCCDFFENKSDREGGALAIQTVQNVEVKNCFFKGNKAGCNLPSRLLAVDDLPNGFGGAIFIDPDFSNSLIENKMNNFYIRNSIFFENEAVNGHAIYIRRGIATTLNIEKNAAFTDNGKNGSTIVCGCSEIEIDSDVVFSFTDPTQSSRPYEFAPGSHAKYENLVFENFSLSTKEEEGNVIHLVEGLLSAEILNCTFKNCGHQGFVVTCYNDNLIFHNNTITFDDPQTAIKGLGIFTQGYRSILGCLFQRCKNDEDTYGGGIYVNPPVLEEGYNLILKETTFDEIYGADNRCFYIKWEADQIETQSINIIKSPVGGITGRLDLSVPGNNDLEFTFNGWSFHNNTVNSSYGGGCGIWITSTNKKTKLFFSNCVWFGNLALKTQDNNGLGGAFQVGSSDDTANTQLQFDYCHFERNTAKADGGALAVQTLKDCNVYNCSFIQNTAGYSFVTGGAIFIDQDFQNDNYTPSDRSPIVSITDCIFESNTAYQNGHALSLYGNDADVRITNATFLNNGFYLGSTLYSVCSKMIIENSTFKPASNGIASRGIELAVKARATMRNIIFENCYAFGNHEDNGGAILLKPDTSSSSLLAIEKQEYDIINCSFTNCGAKDNGGSLYIERNVEKISLQDCVFKGGHVDIGQGVAIFICDSVNKFSIESSVKFIEQTQNDKYLISTGCNEFTIQDIVINNTNTSFGQGIQGVIVRKGSATIENAFFNKSTIALMISKEATEAVIKKCVFSDCIRINKNLYELQVVTLCNNKCIFTNNTINFTSLEKAHAALFVTNHGDIEITHNIFINIKNSNYTNGGICINEQEFMSGEDSSGTVYFQYNVIDGVSSVSSSTCSIFNVQKKYLFNFNHNIIQNCDVQTQYSCLFLLSNSDAFGKEFTLTNLTLKGCTGNSQTGGGFGLLIQFKDREGIFTLKDCYFEGNKVGTKSKNGYGGAFALNSPNQNVEMNIDHCMFIQNTAEISGGALSFRSTKPINITDSIFENNVAKNGGGAIWINPSQKIESISISGCTFNGNKDNSNNGHAVYYQKGVNDEETTFTIDQNCKFIDNGDLISHKFEGYTIKSDAPTFIFMDSAVEFSNGGVGTNALMLQQGSSTITNLKLKHTTSGILTDQKPDIKSHAIHIESTTTRVIIEDCTFDHPGSCGSKNAIYDNGKYSEINNCQFLNNKYGRLTTGAVTIEKIGTHIITNCYLQNGLGDYGVFIYKPPIEEGEAFFTFINNTIDCPQGNDEVALSLLLQNSDKINMENVTIKNAVQNTGSLVGVNLSDDITEFELNKFHFINNTVSDCFVGGSAIRIQRPYYQPLNGTHIIFNECEFDNNKALNSSFNTVYDMKLTMTQCVFTSNEASRNGGALSIYTNRFAQLEFIGCNFSDNKVQPGFNGGALYIHSLNNPVIIDDCTFENTISDTCDYGGAIYIASETTQEVIIRSSHFTRLKVSKKDQQSGNAIFVDRTTSNILIQGCNFNDCGSKGCVIASSGHDVIFDRSTIKFTRATRSESCQGIYVQHRSHFELIDSTIQNCYSEFNGGAFTYVQAPNDAAVEKLVFRNVVLDNCFSIYNNGRALFGQVCSSNVTFYNLTIQHFASQTGYIFTLGHTNYNPNPVLFENCNFIDCSTNISNRDGGGLGFWCSDEAAIIFDKCLFRKLRGIHGGAISFTKSDHRRNTKMTFSECTFDQNQATQGSALYIDIYAQLHVINCNFTNNSNNNANEKYGGGCIFITRNCRDIIIEKTDFYSNQQSSDYNCGNAIYFENQNQLTGYITECSFYDCGTRGSVVYSDGVSLEFIQNKVSFTESGSRAKGLYVGQSCNVHIANSTFKGCASSEANSGGGFTFHNKGNYTAKGLIILENTTFENNEAIKGCAVRIYTNEKPIIRDVIVRNHKKGTHIFVINVSQYFDEDFVLERCTFEDNYFNTISDDEPGGGGSGILISREGVSATTPVTFSGCKFNNNEASKYGGGLSYGHDEFLRYIELIFQDCNFTDNKAGSKGGALSCHNSLDTNLFSRTSEQGKIEIRNCTFKDNECEGKGGSLYIHTSLPFNVCNCTFDNNRAQSGSDLYIRATNGQDSCESISITDSIFNDSISNKNEADWSSIYIGCDYVVVDTEIEIKNNEFNTKQISEKDHHETSIIVTEICNISYDQIITENTFTTENEDNEVTILLLNCKQPQTAPFTPSSKFSESGTFDVGIIEPSVSSKKLTVSKSYSLTYTNKRSVSFSVSFFLSNTYEVVFDASKNTYTVIAIQTNYQSYFPYIIHYFSPIYIETDVTIDITSSKSITQEQLIGIACGSASVFFLVLGVIILAVRRKKEIRNIFDDSDFSYSTTNNDAEIKGDIKEEVNHDNPNDNSESIDFDFWL